MERRILTFTTEYNHFEPGEKVFVRRGDRPDELVSGPYTVKETLPPLDTYNSAVVWLEDARYGVSGEACVTPDMYDEYVKEGWWDD